MSENAEQPPHPFTMDDILVSRTDKRGIILAANKKFQAVSGFSWQNLSQQPHKVIRHKDMPKGVFWYFWNRLGNGNSIGAFVKNKTKSGDHYWAYATAIPSTDTLLSIRIKPSGPIFKMVQTLYHDMLEAESRDGLSPQQSAEAMIQTLKDRGYESYEAFMSLTLADQIKTRNAAIGQAGNTQNALVLNALEAWLKIDKELANTISALSDFKTLPTNMRIQASKLSQEGLPLGVIAGNFGMLTGQIGELADRLLESGNSVQEGLYSGLFTTCIDGLLGEVADSFRDEEGALEGVEASAEIELMERQSKVYRDFAINALRSILTQIDQFEERFATMRTFHSGISVTRVMAEIEIGQIVTPQTSSLSAIVNELAKFLKNEGDRLARMVDGLTEIRTDLDAALEVMSASGRQPAPQRLAG